MEILKVKEWLEEKNRPWYLPKGMTEIDLTNFLCKTLQEEIDKEIEQDGQE